MGWTVVIAPASHSEQPCWQRLAIGQRSELHGQAYWTATSPCTTPEQKLCIPYNCGCVFARPSANALQPRNHPSGDWAAAVPANSKNTAPMNASPCLQ